MTFRNILIICLALLADPFAKADSMSWQNEVIEEVRSFYGNQTKEIQFQILVNPADESAVASADIVNGIYRVVLAEGLLKNPRLNPDSMRMILCHEFGHHFGGAPRRSPPLEWDGPIAPDGQSFESSEGQADYYAASFCFRQLVSGKMHDWKDSRISPILKSRCEKNRVIDSDEAKICARTALAGFDMLRLNFDFNIGFDSPDKSVVAKTITEIYPSRQCRLDTFVAGASCGAKLNWRFDFDRAEVNDCNGIETLRPACWYHRD